jgi:hypothetical protein
MPSTSSLPPRSRPFCFAAAAFLALLVSAGAVRLDAQIIQIKTLPIAEDHPLDPDTPYGASKLAGEKMCLAYAKLYGLAVSERRKGLFFGSPTAYTFRRTLAAVAPSSVTASGSTFGGRWPSQELDKVGSNDLSPPPNIDPALFACPRRSRNPWNRHCQRYNNSFATPGTSSTAAACPSARARSGRASMTSTAWISSTRGANASTNMAPTSIFVSGC